MTVKLRYKEPDGERSRQESVAVLAGKPSASSSADLRLASAVASFGMLLRDSEHKGSASWETVRRLVADVGADDAEGYRTEFLGLVAQAEALAGGSRVAIRR
jgi:Ca-activated chloride channel homolog